MRGEHATTASIDVSINLRSASHKDVENGSQSVSMWTEIYRGKAKNEIVITFLYL
jgi:hypothetical protein